MAPNQTTIELVGMMDQEEQEQPSATAEKQLLSAANEEVRVRKPGLTWKLFLIIVVGVLGNSLPAGYNLGVLNTPQVVLMDFCNRTLTDRGLDLSENQLQLLWSCIVSVLLIGATVGSISAGWLADKLGRKLALQMNSSLGLASAALLAVSEVSSSVEMMIIGRFTVGIFSGMGSSIGPLYLMETAPDHLRGALGALQQFGMTAGILLAQILGQREFLGSEDWWPVLLCLFSISIAIGLVALIFCPESPTYLYIVRGEEEEGLKALQVLRSQPLENLQDELLTMKKERKMNSSEPKWSLMKVLRTPSLHIPLLLVCALNGGQQLSGISALFYYSTNTFKELGLSVKASQYGSIGAGVINVVMACIAVPLVNRCSRRRLILVSLIGVTICLVISTVSAHFQHATSWMPYITIVAFLVFVCVYGIGLGPLPFMIGSELLQQGPRAAGMGLGCSMNWLCNFIVALSFPALHALMAEYVFLLFAVTAVMLGILCHMKLPETKGRSPVEVAAYFEKPTNRVTKETPTCNAVACML